MVFYQDEFSKVDANLAEKLEKNKETKSCITDELLAEIACGEVTPSKKQKKHLSKQKTCKCTDFLEEFHAVNKEASFLYDVSATN